MLYLEKLKGLGRKKLILGGVGGIILIIIIASIAFGGEPEYQFVDVVRGGITETVSITGNTIPVNEVSLGFGASGIIARANVAVGQKVLRGQLLASLNTADLAAQINQAQAAVDSEQAKLEALESGSRPEDIAASEAAYNKAAQDLKNLYASIVDESREAFLSANDAVRVQLDPMFSNAETPSPKINFTTSHSESRGNAEWQRYLASEALNKWEIELAVSVGDISGQETLLKNELGYLQTVRDLLSKVSETLDYSSGISVSTLATYKTNLSTAQAEVNAAIKSLNTVLQSIASQKLTVSQTEAQLNLKKAGTLPQDIKAQEARVKSAQATLESTRAKLLNSQIVAPISGLVTQFDAKVGEYASPGTNLVSIISDSAFEIEAQISETDIGKVAVGNKVTMTLDAFPNETFTGAVFYIDPAQTTTEGVVGYKIKISFDTVDPRIKSGLTANIEVATREKSDVLILPQYAILQNDSGAFVQTLVGKTIQDIPVLLGLQDRNGNTEVISGVSDGDRVLNIGLKRK